MRIPENVLLNQLDNKHLNKLRPDELNAMFRSINSYLANGRPNLFLTDISSELGSDPDKIWFWEQSFHVSDTKEFYLAYTEMYPTKLYMLPTKYVTDYTPEKPYVTFVPRFRGLR